MVGIDFQSAKEIFFRLGIVLTLFEKLGVEKQSVGTVLIGLKRSEKVLGGLLDTRMVDKKLDIVGNVVIFGFDKEGENFGTVGQGFAVCRICFERLVEVVDGELEESRGGKGIPSPTRNALDFVQVAFGVSNGVHVLHATVDGFQISVVERLFATGSPIVGVFAKLLVETLRKL